MEMSTDDRRRIEDDRDALRVMLSVPGAPPGWTLARIAEDCGLSRSRTWLFVSRMLDARSVVRKKQHGVWHFYRSQREQGQTR